MVKSVAIDFMAGFVGLAIVIAGFMTGVLTEDLRAQIILVGALFFCAGALRRTAAPANPWIEGLCVSLGACIPVCILSWAGVAYTSRPPLVAFVGTALIGSIAGVQARFFLHTAHRAATAGIAAAWAAAVVLVAMMLVPFVLERLSTKHVNYAAPGFSFTALDNRAVTKDSLRGRITVLAFWATWCGPCRQELPRIEALSHSYSARPDVAFLAVDDERQGDFASSVVKAKSFFAKRGLTMPLVITARDTSSALGVLGLPALMILDRNGNVRLVHAGYDGAEPLEAIVSEQISTLSQ